MTNITKIKTSVGDIVKDPRMEDDTRFPPGIAVKPRKGVKVACESLSVVMLRLQDPSRDGYQIVYIGGDGKTHASFSLYYPHDILTWTWEEADGSYTPIEDDYDRAMRSMGFK